MFRWPARLSSGFVNKSQQRLAFVNHFSSAVKYFVVKCDFNRWLFFEGSNDTKFIIIQCWGKKFRSVFEDRHHHTAILKFFVRKPQLTQALYASHFVIRCVVAVIHIPHLVRFPIPHAHFGFGLVHYFRFCLAFSISAFNARWYLRAFRLWSSRLCAKLW